MYVKCFCSTRKKNKAEMTIYSLGFQPANLYYAARSRIRKFCVTLKIAQ